MEYPDQEEIRSLCTGPSFDRGHNYWKQGRIQQLAVEGREITATVRGSRHYDVSIEIEPDAIRTHCSCPYDYAGDCKHVVAVLLAVDGRDTAGGEEHRPAEQRPGPRDVETIVENASPEVLRTFLLEVTAEDREMRDRFVAFAGEETGKTVYDYKREIGRLFGDAAGRGGHREYGSWVDFSQYHELAETRREQGDVDAATDIYRAIAETIRENYDRVDDSGGHYGQELERTLESYVDAILEQDPDHETKRPYIEYLVREFLEADYSFASDYYDDALHVLCTTSADLEYWLDLLDERVLDTPLDTARRDLQVESQDDQYRETARPRDPGNDDILYVSDFTAGPLDTDDFTGGALDVEHLAVGPLALDYFTGDALGELHVDKPTNIEEHSVDVSSSASARSVLSTAIDLLDELGEDEALSALYEESYLESRRFCKQYAERLIEQGDRERAIGVVEDGLETLGPSASLRWLAADLYRDSDEQNYRQTLKQLVLDDADWKAYDELKSTCDESGWESIFEEVEAHFETEDRRRLLALYIHEGDLEGAFAELVDSGNLSWFRRYRDPIAGVDPVAYFEAYRELLVPFAAGETGRRHYREVTDHLEAMQGLVPAQRFEEFVAFLEETHSNRPAFLDELEQAGF